MEKCELFPSHINHQTIHGESFDLMTIYQPGLIGSNPATAKIWTVLVRVLKVTDQEMCCSLISGATLHTSGDGF